jgi:hypothetical protein
LKRILLIGAASAVSLFGMAAVAAPAMAGTGPASVTAVTHLNNHPDTTSVCNTVDAYPGVGVIGPDCVWAYDNATEKFTVTPGATPGTYRVTMDYVGSFHGFADPRVPSDTPPGDGLGAALISNGSVKGTIAYDVTATQAPDMSALPGQSPSGTHIADNINLLFGGSIIAPITQDGQYTFTYHQVAGADYTQIG